MRFSKITEIFTTFVNNFREKKITSRSSKPLSTQKKDEVRKHDFEFTKCNNVINFFKFGRYFAEENCKTTFISSKVPSNIISRAS